MATKDEIKAQLDEAGVEYTASMTKDELEALLPTNTEAEETADDAAAEASETFEDASGEVGKVGLFTAQGVLVRTFNIVQHGEDFIDIANTHAKANGFTVKPIVDAAAEIEKDSVNVVNASGNVVRKYSKAIHGDDYLDLAKDFVTKHGKKKGVKIEGVDLDAPETEEEKTED